MLDATVGGAASTSYIAQADATAYFVDRLDSAGWSNASIRQQQNALMMATMRLEAEDYLGTKASSTQRLQWPRFSVTDRSGWLYSSSEIPVVVKQATCELALALLAEPSLFDASGLEQFINVKLGSIDVTPRVGTPNVELPVLVKRLLAPVIGSGARVVRA